MPNIAFQKLFQKKCLPLCIQQLTQEPSYRLTKFAAGGLIASAALLSPNLYAARIGFEVTNIPVNEPRSGSRFVSVTPRVTFEDNTSDWDNLSTCTITGNISIRSQTATSGEDYTLTNASFSMVVTPTSTGDGGPLQFDTVSQDVLFEILADDVEEASEFIEFGISNYGVSCSDNSNRSLSGTGSYGSIIISDPFGEDPNPVETLGAIPVRQKSLSTQLNSLRALSLQVAETQTRSISKEINNARKVSGFSAKNLQVNVDGTNLPLSWSPGAGAGDTFDDFGRWGFFLGGSISTGTHDKDADDATKFDTSLLLAGVDYRITDNFVIGSALGRTVVDAGKLQFAKTDFTRSTLSLFASYYSSDTFYVDAILSSGTSSYDLSRKIETDAPAPDTATATTGGDELSAALGAGYNLNHKITNLRVFTLINYIDSNIDAYNERVKSSAANPLIKGSEAHVNDIGLQSFTADLGLEFSWAVNTQSGVISPTFSLAWEHQFADDVVDINGSFVGDTDTGEFSYHGPKRDSDYVNAQLGVSTIYKNGFTAYATYDTQFNRDDFSSKQYSVGVRWQF